MADFLSGFLEGRRDAAEREIKKMELKAMQAQLKAEEAKAGAKNDLLSLLMGSPGTPDQEVAATGFAPAQGLTAPGGQPFADEQAQFMAQGTPEVPGMNIKQALSDPRGQALALQSGMLDAKGLTDILAKAQLQDFLSGLQGQGGGFSPASVSVANLTGDAGQLRPRETFTKDIMTPEGPRIMAFDKETLQPVGVIGIPKEEKVSPEQGGRISGLMQAQQLGTQVRGALVGQDGQINRQNVFNMQGALGVKGVPFSEGRKIRQQMETAIDAVVRARTGAAMTKDEMQSTLEQFMPSMADSDETIVDKMDRFDQFVGGALDVITLPDNIRKAMEKKAGQPPKNGGTGKVRPGETTARNEKTGEVLVLRNGQWVKP